MTPREYEIASLTADGLLQKQIAAKLGISIKTVEAHRLRMYRKHSLHSIADLTRWFLTNKGIYNVYCNDSR